MFTAADIEFVINYKDFAGYGIYKINDKGHVRFDLLNCHLKDLNAALSKPIVYKEDLEQLKKQVKRVLKNNG